MSPKTYECETNTFERNANIKLKQEQTKLLEAENQKLKAENKELHEVIRIEHARLIEVEVERQRWREYAFASKNTCLALEQQLIQNDILSPSFTAQQQSAAPDVETTTTTMNLNDLPPGTPHTPSPTRPPPSTHSGQTPAIWIFMPKFMQMWLVPQRK
jgi:hypothetical protein